MKCEECDNWECEFNPRSNGCYEPCFYCKSYDICIIDMQGDDDCRQGNCKFEKR